MFLEEGNKDSPGSQAANFCSISWTHLKVNTLWALLELIPALRIESVNPPPSAHKHTHLNVLVWVFQVLSNSMAEKKSQSKVNKGHNDVVKRGAAGNSFLFSVLYPAVFAQFPALKTQFKSGIGFIFFLNDQKKKCSFFRVSGAQIRLQRSPKKLWKS